MKAASGQTCTSGLPEVQLFIGSIYGFQNKIESPIGSSLMNSNSCSFCRVECTKNTLSSGESVEHHPPPFPSAKISQFAAIFLQI